LIDNPVNMWNILFIHSGGFWKNYTFKKAKDLGYSVALAQKSYNLSTKYIDRIYEANVYSPQMALEELSKYRGKFDGVTTFFELAVETTALLVEKWGLVGNSFEAAKNSRDKLRMRQCFKSAHIPSVEGFDIVKTSKDVKKFGKKYTYPLILKPTKFGAAAGVVRINVEKDVERLFDFAQNEVSSFCSTYRYPKNEAVFMVETMIEPDATEVNVDLVIHKGEPIVISIAEKPQDTTGPTFQENDYVMPPVTIQHEHLDTIKCIAINAVKSLGLMWGAVHLEAKVVNKRGRLDCYMLEVGARCGGDLEVPAVLASTGVDLSEIVIRQAMGDFGDDDFKKLKSDIDKYTHRHGIAVQVMYAPQNGIIKNIIIPDEIKNSPRLLEMKFEYHAGDHIHMHYSDYVGAIMVKETTPKTALQLVNKYVSDIKIEMG